MMLSNVLHLFRHDALVATRVLREDAAVEVGPSPHADLIIEGTDLLSCLIQQRGGTVWMVPLADAAARPQVLPVGRRIALGGAHFLAREVVRQARTGGEPPLLPTTQRLERPRLAPDHWTIFIGTGPEARRVQVRDRPLCVGSGPENDLVLQDRTVSHRHCRFEPNAHALVLRDLGSTNGTYVHGMVVGRIALGMGARVRVGRTDLFVSPSPSPSEAQLSPVAASPSMQEVLVEAQSFARLRWPVLVLGPSGAGKEEIARAVHQAGSRKQGPFVALNAGGLPRELVESELFGHEKGAFTGACGQRRGAFELAHGGTLLLDEIGELPLDMQTRLLRVLETWQIRRVGGEAPVSVDVRLICATHRDLAQMVASGAFRQDLFYRLARLVIRIPPLSARLEDVLPLAERFLSALEPDLGPRTLSVAATHRLRAHSWPGNARELRNVLSAAAAVTPSSLLDARDIDLAIRRVNQLLLPAHLCESEIARAVDAHAGNVSAASRALAIPRTTLRDRRARALRTCPPPATDAGTG